MAARSQRRALGALFLLIATFFVGVAVTAGDAGVWPVAVAAGALAIWMLTLAMRGLLAGRPR